MYFTYEINYIYKKQGKSMGKPKKIQKFFLKPKYYRQINILLKIISINTSF